MSALSSPTLADHFDAHLEACGVDLYLDQQAIDTTTPTGKLVFQVTGAFAEFERTMIRQRIKAGLKRAVAQGCAIPCHRQRRSFAGILRRSIYQCRWFPRSVPCRHAIRDICSGTQLVEQQVGEYLELAIAIARSCIRGGARGTKALYKARARIEPTNFLPGGREIMISQRPAEVADRAVPGTLLSPAPCAGQARGRRPCSPTSRRSSRRGMARLRRRLRCRAALRQTMGQGTRAIDGGGLRPAELRAGGSLPV
jgi:hypothetical protein